MDTRAAVLVEQKKPLKIFRLELPKLARGQVLVEVAYTGLCHSQLNEMSGAKGEDRFLPHTLGHEGSGVVLEVGEGVTKVRPGDHVVLTWIKGKGLDAPSCHYTSEIGRVNSGAISTFLQRGVISENRLVPIPKEMPLREAALLGCALPTGAGVVKNEMQLPSGRSFAVFGVGGIGLSALLAAKAAGASPLVAVDVHEEKLARAKKMGATHLINSTTCDPVAKISEITENQGIEYIFESAGKKEAMESAFCSLKAPGMCIVAGNLPKGQQISIDPFDLIRGKRIAGTWGGKSDIDADILEYARYFLDGKWPLADLITHEVPLEEINHLAQELAAGRVGRGLIKL